MQKEELWVKEQILNSSEIFRTISENCTNDIIEASNIIISAIRKNNKILWCGNGGSAAQAQHLSTELVCGLRTHHRIALPSLSLTTDSSLITAWSNDSEYYSVFSRQIEALGVSGDILIAISTSGNSRNVVEAVREAKLKSIKTVGFIGGQDSELSEICDFKISIPSNDTQRIQEGHILVGHIICEIVEREMIKSGEEVAD